MSKSRAHQALAIVALIVCAARVDAADVTVTIHAQPEGASVYENGRLLGATPVNLKYKTARRWSDCLSLQPLTVIWMSGAKATVGILTVCPQQTRRQQFSFLRPDSWPNLQVDLEWALKLAQLSIEQARLAALQAASDPPYVWVPPPPIVRPVHCTSTVIGSQIFTNCL